MTTHDGSDHPGNAPARMLATLPLGTRVVVRIRLAAEQGGGFTDALGYLRRIDESECVIETKRGETVLRLAEVTAAKPVPPPPAPRPRAFGG